MNNGDESFEDPGSSDNGYSTLIIILNLVLLYSYLTSHFNIVTYCLLGTSLIALIIFINSRGYFQIFYYSIIINTTSESFHQILDKVPIPLKLNKLSDRNKWGSVKPRLFGLTFIEAIIILISAVVWLILGIFSIIISQNHFFGRSKWIYSTIYGLIYAAFIPIMYLNKIDNSKKEIYDALGQIVIGILISPLLGFMIFYGSMVLAYTFGIAIASLLIYVLPFVILFTYLYPLLSGFPIYYFSVIPDRLEVAIIITLLVPILLLPLVPRLYEVIDRYISYNYAKSHTALTYIHETSPVDLIVSNESVFAYLSQKNLYVLSKRGKDVDLSEATTFKKYPNISTLIFDLEKYNQLIGLITSNGKIELLAIFNELLISRMVSQHIVHTIYVGKTEIIGITRNSIVYTTDFDHYQEITKIPFKSNLAENIFRIDQYLIVVLINGNIKLYEFLAREYVFVNSIEVSKIKITHSCIANRDLFFTIKTGETKMLSIPEKIDNFDFPVSILPSTDSKVSSLSIWKNLLIYGLIDGSLSILDLDADNIEKSEQKKIKVHLNAISFIQIWKGYLIVGSSDGVISFYHLSNDLKIKPDSEQGSLSWKSMKFYLSGAKCMICKRVILIEDEVQRCSTCHLTAHTDELATWFKSTQDNSCPFCKHPWKKKAIKI